METQIEYAVVSQISDISTGLYRIFKEQWQLNRKLYNKIKHIKDDLTRTKESVTYHIMSSSEMRPDKAIDILNKLKGYAQEMYPHVPQFEKIKAFQEKADSLITYIKLAEHEPSAWERLK